MKSVLIHIIRTYQAVSRTTIVRSMWGWSGCRYQPTCSDYAIEMVTRHGVLYGLVKSAVRLAHCNPFVPVRHQTT